MTWHQAQRYREDKPRYGEERYLFGYDRRFTEEETWRLIKDLVHHQACIYAATACVLPVKHYLIAKRPVS